MAYRVLLLPLFSLNCWQTLILMIMVLPFRFFANEGLVSPDFIQENLTYKCHWAHLHGARKDNLGAGMLYYSLVYSNKTRLCVCLGSGDGFVPRVLRQAQRDLQLSDSKTILIDGNIGKWGRPLWLKKDSFFLTHYPEIDIIIDTTANVAKAQAKDWVIDYLHIDADRSTKGALKDFLDYLPYMSVDGIIVLHDTGPERPCARTAHLIKEMGYPMINFESLGTGVTIIRLK